MSLPARKGFVFTVDAFVSLLLVLLTVFALITVLNIPQTFFPQFEQTHILARDGLKGMDNLEMGEIWQGEIGSILDTYNLPARDRNNSVLEELARLSALKYGGPAEYILRSVMEPVIPTQYGYRFEFYDNETDSWFVVGGRDKPLEKLQATASRIVTIYSIYDDPGTTPFEYDSGNFVGTCQPAPGQFGAIPCEARNKTGFTPGKLVGPTEVRLVVWI